MEACPGPRGRPHVLLSSLDLEVTQGIQSLRKGAGPWALGPAQAQCGPHLISEPVPTCGSLVPFHSAYPCLWGQPDLDHGLFENKPPVSPSSALKQGLLETSTLGAAIAWWMVARPLAPGRRQETGSQESGGSHGVAGLLLTIHAPLARGGRG